MDTSIENAASDDVVTIGEVEEAMDRIRNAIYVSPCQKSASLSQKIGCQVYLKLDNLQRTGSFKERGARNKLMTLTDDERESGVIAASAGNHAQAVAYHGTQLGISTKIVMPEGTPLVKVTRTKQYGGEVVLHGANYDDAYAHAVELADNEGLTFVHPFNDRAIIAGQGTIGLELLEQNPYIDVVLIAIGGGGLAAGTAVALKETNPKIRVIGIEPEVLPSMKTAFAEHRPVEVPAAQTLADGIAVQKVGHLTHKTCEKYLDDIVTVTEEEIANAILVMLEEEKTVAEGAGAAAVAAMIAGKIPDISSSDRVCPIICGGNIDVNVISRIIERGLVAAGRLCRLHIRLDDVPGSLAQVLTLLADMKVNILHVDHNRTFLETQALGSTNVEISMETRGKEHIQKIRDRLQKEGYRIVDAAMM